MLDSLTARDARRSIATAATDASDQASFLTHVIGALREVVPFTAAGTATLDPATLLWTGGIVDGMPEDITARVGDNELLEEDVLKTRALAAARVPAGTLVAATAGEPSRSPRFRKLLAPHGFGDELRIAFTADGLAWGQACFVRRVRFTPDEVAYVASVGRHVAHGLRAALAAPPSHVEGAPCGPGTLLVDDALCAASANDEAHEWLRGLGWDGDPYVLPRAVGAVVARARALRDGHDGPPPRVRARDAEGRWLSIHATGWPDGGWMVVVEPARPLEVLPVVCQAHGLTAREQEVLGLMLRGYADRAVADALVISPHTAKEHARAILRKLGVASRVELAARLHADHYVPA